MDYKKVTKLVEQLAAALGKCDVLPTTDFALCADHLHVVGNLRLAVKHQVDKLESLEGLLEQHFRDNLTKIKASGIAGRVARVQLKNKAVPVVKNWDKFYAHIKKTGEFELLQRRLNTGAVEERREAGKRVPGTGTFNAVKVSCTKL